jgi:hypothetical protein
VEINVTDIPIDAEWMINVMNAKERLSTRRRRSLQYNFEKWRWLNLYQSNDAQEFHVWFNTERPEIHPLKSILERQNLISHGTSKCLCFGKVQPYPPFRIHIAKAPVIRR